MSITVAKQKGRPKAGDLADALAFALRFQGRKRAHNADGPCHANDGAPPFDG